MITILNILEMARGYWRHAKGIIVHALISDKEGRILILKRSEKNDVLLELISTPV